MPAPHNAADAERIGRKNRIPQPEGLIRLVFGEMHSHLPSWLESYYE